MEQHLQGKGLKFERFSAIDGRKLSDKELEDIYDPASARKLMGRELVPGEIGCTLSHLGVFREILERGLPGGFILEDDCELNSDAADLVNNFPINHIPANGIVILHRGQGYQYRNKILYTFENIPYTIKKAQRLNDALAYYVSAGAARALLDWCQKICLPFDAWRDYVSYKLISLYAVSPGCARSADYSEEMSAIENDRSTMVARRKKSVFSRAWNKLRIGFRNHVRTNLAYYFKGIEERS